MASSALLGSFQRPLIGEDPTLAAIPGGASCGLVNTTAPVAGTVVAVVTADVALSVTLTAGANTETVTGSAVVLQVVAAAADPITLTATAVSGPSYRVQGSVSELVPVGITLPDLGPIVTAPGQLITASAAGAAELLTKGAPGTVLTVGGTDPSGLQWAPLSGVTSFNTRTGAVTLGVADLEATFTAAGQLLVGTGNGAGELLAKGAAGSVLTVGGADPSGLQWAPAAGAGVTSFNTRTGAVTLGVADLEATFTAAGQLLVGTGNGAGELLANGAAGSVLTVGGADPSGLQWVAPSAGALTSAAGNLAADVTLSSTLTTVMTTASLGVGTWLVHAGISATNSNTVADAAMTIVAGTATASFAGQTAAVFSDSTANSAGLSAALCCIVTVTVAGTLIIKAKTGTGGPVAKATTTVGSFANATGWTAVQIA